VLPLDCGPPPRTPGGIEIDLADLAPVIELTRELIIAHLDNGAAGRERCVWSGSPAP
jgi:hypothetical protein